MLTEYGTSALVGELETLACAQVVRDDALARLVEHAGGGRCAPEHSIMLDGRTFDAACAELHEEPRRERFNGVWFRFFDFDGAHFYALTGEGE